MFARCHVEHAPFPPRFVGLVYFIASSSRHVYGNVSASLRERFASCLINKMTSHAFSPAQEREAVLDQYKVHAIWMNAR